MFFPDLVYGHCFHQFFNKRSNTAVWSFLALQGSGWNPQFDDLRVRKCPGNPGHPFAPAGFRSQDDGSAVAGPESFHG